MIFNSGDGVEVELIDIKARLKSREYRMMVRCFREVFNIRDILAITLIKNKDDSLKLFPFLTKTRGSSYRKIRFQPQLLGALYETPEEMYGV